MKIAPTGTILDPTIPIIDIPADSGSGQVPKQTPGKPADASGGTVGPGGGPGPTAPGGTAGEGVVSPSSGSLSSIIQATQRLNPCMELDVDVLAVTRADVISTTSDWTTHAGVAGVLTNVTADTSTGTLRLTPTTPVSLFSQTNSATIHHFLQDAIDGVEQYALDFFPDPTITQGVSFTLSSLDLDLRMGNLKGYLRVQVSYYDQSWRLVPMGDPIDILSGDIVNAVGTSGGIYTIDFLARGHRYVFQGGFQNSVTGDGFDGTNVRTSAPDSQKISHLNLPRGLSISIQPFGKNATDVWIGCVPNATATQFQTGSFWRVAANRNCGPYNPTNQPFTGNTTDHNPDNYLVTGAVPNFGAKVVTNGQWGIARRIPTSQRAQGVGSWEQPYHNLKVVAYPSTGSSVNVLDMGATPTNPVQLRIDDWQEFGTSISYVLKGSNTANTGPWTAITLPAPPGGPDGAELTGANLYRWYQLTTTFTPGPSGGTKYATPALQSWSMVERVPLSTYRYLKDFDSTVVADPVTAQSSIGELTLPVMNVGRQDFRDLATSLGSNWAPSRLEAHVFARNTRTNIRYFLNAYRLENREPQFGVESMTFVSGMDRLSVTVPAAVETYRYPSSGQVAITNVTNVGAVYTITVGGTPFTINALIGFRMHGVTGVCAGLDFAITTNPTTSQFTINVPNGAIPTIGDTIEIHSDVTTRVASPYLNQNFGLIYKDILAVQAAVPARYRGQLPGDTNNKVYATDGVTERLASYTFDSAGVKALDVIQDVALHCGGFPTWDRGQIQYADFYGPKVSMATWDERHYVTLETPIGADRRMPSVKVKYGYQPDLQRFTNESTYEDFDTLVGWGRANLFDVFELPDNVCKWNDVTEAKFMADMLQRAWKSGVRLWKVKTVLDWPWLSQGDAVTIMTDQYTDRRLQFSADGLTDQGTPVMGRTAAIGVIVGKNLYGNEFIVGVRGLDAITSTAVATTGTRARQATLPAPPAVTLSFDSNDQIILNSVGDAATVSQKFSILTASGAGNNIPITPPTSAAIRATTAVNTQSLTSYATGVYATTGRAIACGVFAYNTQGDESQLAMVVVVRQADPRVGAEGAGGGAGQGNEEYHRGGSGGTSTNPLAAGTLYDATGSIPIVDTVGRRLTSGSYVGDAQAGTVGKRHGIWFHEVFDQTPGSQGYSNAGSVSTGTLVQTAGVSTVGTNVYQATGYEWWIYPYYIPFNPSKLYRLRVRYRCTVDAGTANSRGFYIGMQGFDATGAVTNSNGGYNYVAVSGATPSVASGWQEATAWVMGATSSFASGSATPSTDPNSPSDLRVNTSLVKPIFAMNYPVLTGTTDGTFQIDYFSIEETTYNSLDHMPDGGSYKRVGGVNGSNQITPQSSVDRNRCKVAFSSTPTQTSGTTPTVMTLWSETGFWDVGNLHDNSTNPSHLTIPSGGNVGAWVIHASIGFQFNATGDRYIEIRKNGTTVAITCVRATSTASNETIVGVYFFDNAPTVGDYYEVALWQNSGSTLNISSGTSESFFSAIHLW